MRLGKYRFPETNVIVTAYTYDKQVVLCWQLFCKSISQDAFNGMLMLGRMERADLKEFRE